MAQVLYISALMVIGILVCSAALHKRLSSHPIAGAVLFGLISALLYWHWRGIWQLWTLHLLLAILVMEYLFLAMNRHRKLQVTVRFNQKLFLFCAYIGIGGSLLFPAMTSLSGSQKDQAVGTWKMVVESSERTETLSQIEGLRRRFTIQLYYPIDQKSGKTKKWFDGGEPAIRGLALSYGLPEILISHLKTVDSGAYLSRRIIPRDAPYQVIVISHGLKGSSDQYTRLAESLAGKGYLLAVINHPYSAYATIFGKKDAILGAQSAAAQMDLVDQKIELEKQITLIQQGDLMECFKVLDQLNQGYFDARFKNQLDLSDMTLVGHQLGGGAVITTLNQVPYVKTGILINPVVEQIPKKYILQGSAKPVVTLISEDYIASNNAAYLKRYLMGSAEPLLWASEKGTDLDMTDMSQVTALFPLNGLSDGSAVNKRLIRAQTALIDQAVQKYSQGQIFEDIPSNLDSARLGLIYLKPEDIDAKQR